MQRKKQYIPWQVSPLEICKTGENKWAKTPKHWMRPFSTRRWNYQALALFGGNSVNLDALPPAALQILWKRAAMYGL